MSDLALAYALHSPHPISLCFYLAFVQICWPNHVISTVFLVDSGYLAKGNINRVNTDPNLSRA